MPFFITAFPYCPYPQLGADGTAGRLPLDAAISVSSVVHSDGRAFDGDGPKKLGHCYTFVKREGESPIAHLAYSCHSF